MQPNPKFIYYCCLLALFTLLAPWPSHPVIHAQTNAEQPATLALAALSNATYHSAYATDGAVTLTNGSYMTATGTLDEQDVTLTGYVAYGDLTGDGVDEAVVVLETDTPGTAVFYELAVVASQKDQPVNVATTLIGDRIALQDLQIVDKQIIVEMTTHGAGDADCCPTHGQRVTYTLAKDKLTQLKEEALTPASNQGVFQPAADPTVVTLTLGGADGLWLDPTLVSIDSGAQNGPGVEASPLGHGCAGTINERPNVVLNWTADERVEKLRIFFLSMGDPAMVVVTPSGDILCNDDLNPLVLDPSVVLTHPASGRYAIYLGNFADRTATPGFLVVTSQNFSPATLDLAQLFPRVANPGAVGETKPLSVLQINAPVTATAAISLTQASIPMTTTVIAGGDLGAYEIELGNDLCTGFISAAPTYRFDWQGTAKQLVLFFDGPADTTLVVRDPDGAFQCNDDLDGAHNLNPYLDLPPIEGRYDVWVGSFAPKTPVTGTLTLATTTDLQPAPLKSSK